MPLEPGEVDRHANSKVDADRIPRPAGMDARDLLWVGEQSLREQEADGEIGVVARGSHRHRDRSPRPPAIVFKAQADLEGLLDRQRIGEIGDDPPLDPTDPDLGQGRVEPGTDSISGEQGNRPPPSLLGEMH